MSRAPVQHWDLGIGPISCHSWNKDKTQLAASASNNIIHIFERQTNGSWKEIHVLKEHDLLITGLDWASNTNRIVSCSQDKNAFVWTFDIATNVWKPELVLVRSNRAATSVKWSPLENKFAVASGARLVAICSYEKENDWWVSKQIKKPIRSTVTSIDWHPNNVLIAVGSCDFKVRVFSAFVKEVDEKPAPNPWGSKMPFGELMKEYSSLGWIHDVAFSPSGCKLAWVSHDSTIALVDKADNQPPPEPIVCRMNCLPFTTLRWTSENNIIAAGHDCSPMLFSYENRAIKLTSKLDVPAENKNGTGVNSAFQMFRNFDRNAAGTNAANGVSAPKTLHQNAIAQIQPHTGKADNITKFSTCGIDGLVALWDLQNRATASAK
ncbi:actin-related protein 2/3 complex subunit 1A [Ditylenchus destructor]|nr:actin-related protein 2/3 complex subunit 1A [Ditylenchus destructor]